MLSPRRRSLGQAMAEFALVVPFFFVLVLGVIEGGRFVFYYNMLNNATREGARYAIIHGSNAPDGCESGPMPDGTASCDLAGDRVREAVRRGALGLAGVGQFESIGVFWCPADGAKPCPGSELTNARGNPVTVRAVYQYRPVINLLPMIRIQSESTLVINN